MRLVRKPAKTGRTGTTAWRLAYLEAARRDAKAFLDDDRYAHVVQQFDVLAREPDPSHSEALDVRPIEDFFELRDRGGILGKINVRVFFWLKKAPKTIVVLGGYKKVDEDQTPRRIVICRAHSSKRSSKAPCLKRT